MKKGWKIIRNALIALAAVVLTVLVTLQIVLRPQVLTRLVNRIAADYVEGDVDFGNIRAHVIKSFPYINVEATDFSITYPHGRYAQYDTLYPDNGRRFSLMRAGRGTEKDTLAALKELSVSVDYMAFLKGKEIHVHKAELTHPRIFAHYYDSTAANWDILPIGSDKDTTKEKKPLPRIVVNRVALTERPLVVFTDPLDTLHALFTMRRLTLDGKIDTDAIEQARTALSIDSLFVSGRLPADTLALGLERLRAKAEERRLNLDAGATAFLATNRFGRLKVPVGLLLDGEFPEREDGRLEVVLNRLGLSLSALELNGSGRIVRNESAWDLDLKAAVKDCPLGEIIREYDKNIPMFKKIRTDASLSLDATVKGPYGDGQTPSVDARLLVPQAELDYEGLGRKGRVALDAQVTTDNLKDVNAYVEKLLLDIVGARINVTGSATDVLGEDPLIQLDGTVKARVDSLTRAFTAQKGITGTGNIDATLHGRVRKSQLDMTHIGAADILCKLTGRQLSVRADSMDAVIPRLDMELATRANKIDRNIRQGARVLALKALMDSLDVNYKDMLVRGGDVTLLLQNSADILRSRKELTPLMGLLKVGGLRLKDASGLSVRLRDNTETFRIAPATKARPTPRLTLTSKSGRVGVRKGVDFYALKDLNFDVSASRHQPSRRFNAARRNHLLDSLQRVYPGVPRDSLFRQARLTRMYREKQDAFAASDVKITLSGALQQYVRNWDIEGNLDLGDGRIRMPSFPLRTTVSAVRGSFDNDTLDLKNITLTAGASDLSAQAQLTGLRRALIGRGKSHLKLKADVRSNFLDANELMRGYAYYVSYEPPAELQKASDEEVEAASQQQELPDSVKSKLIVIPSNLDVDFTLEASGIKYDSLRVSWAAADIAMRNRTLQITNAIAASNMGDLYLEGFYATRSEDDIKGGFDLNMVDITAEKVITLFPAVDTLMPLLTSFGGNLDCELAATSDIDRDMNLILPSVDGILKISGKNLTLKESKEFTKIARLLMFRDKKKVVIDNMSVTGMVQDNRVDIFPFVLDVDRYLLAASGYQILDNRFDYHVSVIRSPLLFKFGLNAWGNDYGHIHYGLGKARYKNTNVPVYTRQLDTVQYSLVAAIHNIFELGVEKAMQENRSGRYMPSTNPAPVHAAADTMGHQAMLDSLEHMENTLDNVVERVSTRREALKEEVLRLEDEAALPDKKKKGK